MLTEQEYRNAVLSTESILPEGTIVDKELLGCVFQAISDLGDALDLAKKMYFYKQMTPESEGYGAFRTQIADKIANASAVLTESMGFEPDLGPVSNIRMLHSLIGMVGETGEMAKIAVDLVVHDKPVDKTNFVEESGDHRWYKNVGLEELGVTEQEEAVVNKDKLFARYGGSFSVEKVINRDTVAERQLMDNLLSGPHIYGTLDGIRVLGPKKIIEESPQMLGVTQSREVT